MSRHLKSLATWLIVQQVAQTKPNEKNQSPVLLGLCERISHSLLESPHKGPVTCKACPCHDVIIFHYHDLEVTCIISLQMSSSMTLSSSVLLTFYFLLLLQRLFTFISDCPDCRGPQTAMFMWPTWGPPGSCWPQVGPMNLAIRSHFLTCCNWD